MFRFLPTPANSSVEMNPMPEAEMNPMPDSMVKEMESMSASERSAKERKYFKRERQKVFHIIAERARCIVEPRFAWHSCRLAPKIRGLTEGGPGMKFEPIQLDCRKPLTAAALASLQSAGDETTASIIPKHLTLEYGPSSWTTDLHELKRKIILLRNISIQVLSLLPSQKANADDSKNESGKPLQPRCLPSRALGIVFACLREHPAYVSGDLVLWYDENDEEEGEIHGRHLVTGSTLKYSAEYEGNRSVHSFSLCFGDRELTYRHNLDKSAGRVRLSFRYGDKPRRSNTACTVWNEPSTPEDWQELQQLLRDILTAAGQLNTEKRVGGFRDGRQRVVANWPFAYSGEATNTLDIHTGQILWVSELNEDDEWVEAYDDASGASGYVPTNYVRLEKDDESSMELMRAWYKFADDCGMASEYLPLVAFLPEELRGVPVNVNKVFEFSRMTEDRLLRQIDWI